MSKREQLIDSVVRAIQTNSTMAVFFHNAIAGQAGLGATEEKTLLILSGWEKMTAGDVAQYTGLTTASVTSLLDRLESKGFVRRVRDTQDRRRVIVEPIQEKIAELNRLFTTVEDSFVGILDGYSDEQLATIADFLKRSAEYSQRAIERIEGDKGSG